MSSAAAAHAPAPAPATAPRRISSHLELPFVIGQQVHGFTVRDIQLVKEFSLTAVHLTHDATGADYVHMARNDSNNVFAVSFRTAVANSTGVPHILEHTTLCGSNRFPCRDPFFKMLNRSLATFMNAWTASDYTMYPFSTQNGQDYRNLLSVYLDATFFPLLRERDFAQEGWRVENTAVENKASPLVFKGVVYNEMKGALSDPDQLYNTRVQQALYPTSLHANVSGGDPPAITDLSYDDLIAFHRDHYHPSNALFFSYGDLALEEHLELVQREALCHFGRQPLKPHASGSEQRWTQPRTVQLSCPPIVGGGEAESGSSQQQAGLAQPHASEAAELAENEEAVAAELSGSVEDDHDAEPSHGTMSAPPGVGEASAPQAAASDRRNSVVSVAWVMHDVVSVYDTLVARIVGATLAGGPSTPFYRALLESGLGLAFSPNTGCSTSEQQPSFAVGLKDVRLADADAIVKLIDDTLSHIAVHGIDAKLVEGELHQLEITLKHQSSNFGLSLASMLVGNWVQHIPMQETLAFNEAIARFRHEFATQPDFIQRFVRRHLLTNPHRLVAVMSPDAGYQAGLLKEESERLARHVALLDDAAKEKLHQQGLELQQQQNRIEDLSCLPIIRVDDVERKAIEYTVQVERVNVAAKSQSHAPVTTSVLPEPAVSLQQQRLSSLNATGAAISMPSAYSAPEAAPLTLQTSTQPTNGVSYLHGIITYPMEHALAREVQPYLPLFMEVLTAMGAGDMDYREFSNATQTVSGGTHAAAHYCVNPLDDTLIEQGVLFASHFLDRYADRALDLFSTAMLRPRLDDPKRLVMLAGMMSQQINSIADSGHQYAMTYAARNLSGAAAIFERDGGITQLQFIRSLEQTVRDSPEQTEKVLALLRDLAREILPGGRASSPSRLGLRGTARFSLNSDASGMPIVRDTVLQTVIQPLVPAYASTSASAISASPSSAPFTSANLPSLVKPTTLMQGIDVLRAGKLDFYKPSKTFFPFPFLNVHHCALAFPSVPATHADHVPLQILARILTHNFLLREVREKGGAYGAGANAGRGVFTFYSYRDPRALGTFDSFHDAIQWVLHGSSANGTVTDQHLADAKLSILAAVDSPVSPGKRGMGLFLSGYTREMRQRARDAIFATTIADVQRVAQQYLANNLQRASAAVVGPSSSVDGLLQSARGSDWTVIALD
ncbi:presequence protease [Capsaspora owczarzaki ATCC 30864]|nr:presequence protease [Capsaspora owczarzaki ATCC 30864]|eukprot:XP_004343847.1 presequence protease [Capsaspora owczarzaki ATCC 30864]